VPSFGEWGFVLAGRGDYVLPTALPSGLRFLSLSSLPPLFQFPADLQPVHAQANRLDDQALVRYYGDEWKQIER
jgi:spermidine synthase